MRPASQTPTGRRAGQAPTRRTAGILLEDPVARKMTFNDSPDTGRSPGAEALPEEMEEPAQPDTPAPQSPPPARPGQDGGEAPSGRPSRTRKPPVWSTDYEMAEMSEVRQPSSYMVEDVGVGGMLEDDIPGAVDSRLREAATRDAGPIVTCAGGSSGRDEPDTRATTSTCIGRVLITMKDLCRDNGLNENVTAEMVGRLAIDLCKLPI